jgi:succinyl-CoA synthetase beta subunit/citryl-CoA synthetase large subunit
VRFYEYEAKRILGKHGIGVPKGALAKTAVEAEKIASELGGPVFVKAQVLTRARAKAGGIQLAATPADAKRQAEAIFGREYRGRSPVGVLVEKKVDVVSEYATGATYDGIAKRPVMLLADAAGDIDDIAQEQPARVRRRHFSALLPHADYRAKELVKALGLGGSDLTRMTSVVSRLADILLRYDLAHAEIGSLGKTADGQLVALDCHFDMEVEGRARQKAILDELGILPGDTRTPRDPTPFEIQAAKIDKDDPRGVAGPVVEFDGNIGLVIGAGGGSLTTFDAIKKHGGRPANYAALGGNPSVKKTIALTKLVLTKPGVEKIAVISNVVSNTRADLVARGVIKGVLELGFQPADKITVFRVPGAWESDAVKILNKYGVEFCDRTVSISEAARRAVQKIGR